MSSLISLFRTLGGAFRRCATRFPVTLVFVLALVCLQLWMVATEGVGVEDKLLSVLFYYLSVGTLLSLSLHLWAEEVKRRSVKVGVQIVVHALLAADAVFLYYNIEGAETIDIIIAHGAAILAIGLSVFFLSFFREKDDIPAWNFAQTVVGMLALTIIVGAVMSGGLSLLTFSLHQLFGVNINSKCYLYILIICSELLPLLMFLGLLPQGERKHDRLPQPTGFLQGTIRYLFLPLAGLYLLVLYVYAATILIRWELPNGWVSWLVVALMTGCIAIEAGLYPARVKYAKPTDNRIARWLPLLALPLLVLMTVGIVRRFMDYGITINRLYLATLNLWFYFVCIGLIAGRVRRISWIPISFSIVFLLTSALPVNYAGITRSTLRGEVKKVLAQSQQDSLPLTQAQYEAWLKSLPDKQGIRMEAKLHYLQDMFGKACIGDLVQDGVPYDYVLKVDTLSPQADNIYYSLPMETSVEMPQGYRYCTSYAVGQMLESYKEVPALCTFPLRQAQDSVSVPLDSLRVRAEAEQHPLILPTQKGNRLLVTRFSFYTEKRNYATWLEGLLFHNETKTTNK